ncbi:hypothetical protein A2Z33_01605 [Candidatus Gottesmanbacteria bacterium RBG_16_52_11]|uniref:HAD family hydrolase n=1 Tax=Candidatus Gottesmanbacteria bacterium RBG_16_52_11 TaxID=1798374 RepID=A0A1F5YP40_9BACT|nr:MAG: hypothetical protein A2Z33_01605 [Candidatus Gottesmanbacteria bacterium RBG_16_52_11]
MNPQEIRLLAWDFDGTLYRLNQPQQRAIHLAQMKVITEKTGQTLKQAEAAHRRLYPGETPSGTEAVARICGISRVAAVLETEKYYDRSKLLVPDARLAAMFKRLRHLRHVMFVNGKKDTLVAAIRKLGVDPGIFETFVGPETTGVLKPDPAAFRALLAYSGLPAGAHLVIGDREQVDLAQARKTGMKTCLVWSDAAAKTADWVLQTVYDVPHIFG